jgi:DmsE family decaheme c-type cytochrome
MTVAHWCARPRSTVLGTLLLIWALPAPGSSQQVEWSAISPGYRGANFVHNDQVCADCHDDVVHEFDGNAHILRYFAADNTAVRGTCEACHGPRGRHVADQKPVAPWPSVTPAQQAGICMQCHANGTRLGFKTGAHLAADVSCTACHGSRQQAGSAGMLVRSTTTATCYGCHSNVRGQMSKASHHPVREGRMECASCHNVHGSQPSLLKTPTITETCNGCHTDKRGPFLWEHAPVRESCSNCHEAHGTSNRKLLVRKESFLCLQCHSYGGHINLPRYNRTSNPYGEGCVNCHITVHGSNHPSGVKLTR